MAAWRGVPRLRYRGRPVLAWLYRVAANMANDRLRERMREPLPTDVVTGPPVADASDRVADRDVLGRALAGAPGRPAARGPPAPRRRLLVRRGRPGDGPKRRRVSDARAARRPPASRGARAGGCPCLGLTTATRHAGSPRCSTGPSRATPTWPPWPACSVTPRRRPGWMCRRWRSSGRSSARGRERHRAGRRGRASASPAWRSPPPLVLAVLIVLALPFTSAPVTVDVQARALAALGNRGTVLSVVELVRPGPGQSFPASLRTGWIDIEGRRQRWTQSVGGTVVAETLVDHGRVTRYDPASGTAVVATSCAALASGCAEGVDPVAFYRRALAASGPLSSSASDTDGRRVFRVALPVQTLADSVRIVQVATIDAATYLPRRIEWRQVLAGGRERTFADIVVRDISRSECEHRVPGRVRPSAASGTADHPGHSAGRSRTPPRRATAHGRRGSGARPLAVVVRARLPRAPAERDRAHPLHRRDGGADPLRRRRRSGRTAA